MWLGVATPSVADPTKTGQVLSGSSHALATQPLHRAEFWERGPWACGLELAGRRDRVAAEGDVEVPGLAVDGIVQATGRWSSVMCR